MTPDSGYTSPDPTPAPTPDSAPTSSSGSSVSLPTDLPQEFVQQAQPMVFQQQVQVDQGAQALKQQALDDVVQGRQQAAQLNAVQQQGNAPLPTEAPTPDNRGDIAGRAQRYVGSQAWGNGSNTYCETFTEQMTGSGWQGASAADAWNRQLAQKRATPDPSLAGAKVGDAVYFGPSGDNGGYGHTGVITAVNPDGTPVITSVTRSGVQAMPVTAFQAPIEGYVAEHGAPSNGQDPWIHAALGPRVEGQGQAAPPPIRPPRSLNDTGFQLPSLDDVKASGQQLLGSLGQAKDGLGDAMNQAFNGAQDAFEHPENAFGGVLNGAADAVLGQSPITDQERQDVKSGVGSYLASQGQQRDQGLADLTMQSAADPANPTPADYDRQAGATTNMLAAGATGPEGDIVGPAESAAGQVAKDIAGTVGRSADDILAVPKDYTPTPSDLPPNMDPVNIDLTKYTPEAQAATVQMADAMGGFASSRFKQTNAATVEKALDLMHDPVAWDEFKGQPMTSVPNAEQGLALNLSKQMAWTKSLEAASSGDAQAASDALRQAAFFDERVSAGASRQGGALQAQQIGMKELGPGFGEWMQRAREGRDLTPQELEQLKLVPSMTPDLGHALLRNMTQLVTGSAGAIYGYNQDPSDDEKARITKAILFGTAGLAAGHVLTGGPMTPGATMDRWQGTYINNILSPGTLGAKGTNDVWMMVNGGVIRAEQRALQAANEALHGNLGAAGTSIKAMAPEAIRYYAGEMASWRSGLQKFVDAMNPSTVNRPLETYGKTIERTAFEAPGAGQYAGSFITRAIQGMTDMAQEIIAGGHEAANVLAKEKGVDQKALVDPYVAAQRNLLMNPPEGNAGMVAQHILNGLSKIPGIGLLVAPFHTIPANLLDKTLEYMPGIGLLNMRSGHVQDVLVHQINGLVGLMGARMAFGDGINGAGPQDPAVHRDWVEKGNQEWSVRVPGTDSWLSMKHLPPPLQGPLRELGAIEDTLRNGGSQPGLAALEQFGSAIKSMDFMPRILSVIDSGFIKNSNHGEELTKQAKTLTSNSAGDVSPSYLRIAAQAERGDRGKADATGTDLQGQLIKQGENSVAAGAQAAATRGVQAAVPGLEKEVPAQRYSSGDIRTSDVQGAGAAFNPFGLTHLRNDPYIDTYAGAGSEPPVAAPTSLSVGTNASIPLRPDEQQRLQQLTVAVARPIVEKYGTAPGWNQLPVQQRHLVLQAIELQASKAAQGQLLAEMAKEGPLVQRIQDNHQAQAAVVNQRASQAGNFVTPSLAPTR